MKKILTIGITTYNNYPFICELLYSLKNELDLIENWNEKVEIMIFDDASTDEKFNEYLKNYITFADIHISSKNTGGPSKGRNFIIEKAKSKYLFFIDGDDSFIGNAKDLLGELQQTDADLLLSNVNRINNDGMLTKSPFIFSQLLFSESINKDDLQKIAVNQTGIWSIYKVSFLKKNKLSYETGIRYEDNYFMTQIHLAKPTITVLKTHYYGWRVNYSSFSYNPDSITQRLQIFDKILLLLKEKQEDEITPWLFYSIWNQTYINLIRKYPANSNYKVIHKKLEQIRKLNKEEIKGYFKKLDRRYVDFYTKIHLTLPIFYNYHFLELFQKIRSLKENKKKIFHWICSLFLLLPINDKKIFFTSHYGDYNDNSKYHYLKMKNSPKYKNHKFIFAVKEIEGFQKKSDFIDYNNRLLFFYHHYTAKTIFFNSWYSPQIKKKRGQIWTQLWHGYPYKKVYKDINTYFFTNDANRTIEKDNSIRNWDFFWSLNRENTEIFRKLFPSPKVIEKLYPKIEWLVKNQDDKILCNKIREKHKLGNQKLVLYAPTYRPYKFYIDLEQLLKFIDDTEVLLIHLHPMMKYCYLNKDILINEKIIVLENIQDIQEILILTDRLITDYSSLIYDYEQMSKPIDYFTPDRELYSTIHGLYK